MHSNQHLEICFENGNKYHQLVLIGASPKGCMSFTAKTNCGTEVFITVWTFDLNKLTKKCPIDCDEVYKSACGCEHKNVSTLIAAFKKRATYLIQNVDHTNLVRYVDVNCIEANRVLTVHLVQEYIENAKSVSSLWMDGVLPSLAPIAEWLLKVISYLEKMNPKITHGYIKDGSIFLDKCGAYRVADFNLIPYLIYLKDNHEIGQIDDLQALGTYIGHKNETVQFCSQDFIEKCCSANRPSCQSLLSHAFLSNVHIGDAITTYNGPLLNQFEIGDILGSGAYGSVVKARQPVNQEFYALKIIKIPIGSKGKYTKVKREVDLISQLNHKNIVKYLDSWEQTADANELNIVFYDDESNSGSSSSEGAKALGARFVDVIVIQMELCEMDLRQAIEKGKTQNKSTRLRWFEEILDGLTHLHENGIIHRDLNPKNILLDSLGHVKIGDFGLAITVDLVSRQRSKVSSTANGKSIRSSQTGLVGTSYYVAPELSENASFSEYGKAADIYSLGIIFFEMLHQPFKTTIERAKILEDIRKSDIKLPKSMNCRDFPTEVEMIKKMLDHNSKLRPTATSLISTDLGDEGLDEIVDDLSVVEEEYESAYLSDNDLDCSKRSLD